MHFFIRIVLLLILVSPYASAMDYEESDALSAWPKNDDITFLIFAFLIPSEKGPILEVCKEWRAFSQSPKFYQDAFTLYKGLTCRRVSQGSCYLVRESKRLQSALSEVSMVLCTSDFFFNFQGDARNLAEIVLRRAAKKASKLIGLFRNSSKNHLIAFSYILSKDQSFKAVDISPSDDAIKVGNLLDHAQHIELAPAEISEANLQKEKSQALAVGHNAIEIRENPTTKTTEFVLMCEPANRNVTLSSFNSLIKYFSRTFQVLNKNEVTSQ